jgi:hypothetical protein
MTQLAFAAAVVLWVGVTVATWWLVGDQSSTTPDNADYAIRPPFHPSAPVERILGVGSAALGIVAGLWLIWASLGHGFDPAWWSVVGPSLLLGMLLALGWRVFTAGVIGANIGAGLFMMLAGPVILVLLAWVIFRTLSLLH